MSQPKLVRVEWDDAASNDIWRRKGGLHKEECLRIRSVGYVIRSTHKEMVLAQSLSESDSVSNTMAIPRGCIRKVRLLRSKK